MSFRARIAPLILAGAIAGARADAQSVVVRDPGPAQVGRRLARALTAPHRLIAPGPIPTILARDSAYATTVIVLAHNVVIEGRVRGDVFVVGGDAFLHPGAVVDGRVIAIGGAVYESALAVAHGGTESHRDFTYETRQVLGGYALDYTVIRERPTKLLSLPGIYGVRIPTYDRVDGLALPFGPLITLDTGYVEIDPTVTYRSNLGEFDPAVQGTFAFGRLSSVNAYVGRGTFTNDDWIWSDLLNSAATLFQGLDTRNYFRADRAETTLHHLFESTDAEFEPWIGIRGERDRSVGYDSVVVHAPWSLFSRNSINRMRRPNPAIIPGKLGSVLLGGRFQWQKQGVITQVNVLNEAGAFEVGSLRFLQTTFDAEIRFPTFGVQRFWLSTHLLYTFGDDAPPQRWSYLGGPGTIPTLDLLSLGGDRLVYIESNYLIPFSGLDLPVLGPPSLTIRHMIGSAGVGRLPAFEQNLDFRFALSFARVDFALDPVRRSWNVGVGLSLQR